MQTIEFEKAIKTSPICFSPQGTSMWPLFVSEKDKAIVKKADRSVKRGDVVVYRRENGPLIIHRVHHVNKKGIYCVGDHQTEIEGPNTPENVIGIMVEFVRNGKTYSTQNAGYIILSRMWLFLRPLRWKIIHLGHFAKVLFRVKK